MLRMMFATLVALSSLLSVAPVSAQSGTRDQIRSIEQEYARQSNGRMISDSQLEYYLDRSNSGWSMRQISDDMASSSRANSPWRPQTGWSAREVVCTSIDNRYRECAIPFRGRAAITQQISQSACIEGQSWGQKAGAVWVNRGCRARFGIVAGGNADMAGNYNNNRTIVCKSYQGRMRTCQTGFRGRVQLSSRLNNSAACVEGRSWGQREGSVWVSRGCRAQFTSVGRPGRRDDGNWGNSNNDNRTIVCQSHQGKMRTCATGFRGRVQLSSRLNNSAACVEGRSWGQREGSVWVSRGCRAQFTSVGRPDRRDDGNGNNNWNRDSNYAVTCQSVDNRRSNCQWDSRYGNPRIVQQMSQNACIEGRDWGYDNRGGLWVEAGCRARFGYR